MAIRHWSRSRPAGPRGRWAALYATMNPDGHIFISRHTYERLGSPEAFELLYDEPTNSIGMVECPPDAKHAYHARSRSGHGGRVIRAFAFMQEFGIALDETVRFTSAKIDEDNVLILDLRKTRSSAKPRKAVRNGSPSL